jgi:hypothetical protein
MTRVPWLGGVLALCWAAAGGCTTTGDPRQGGLFGWSEAKARDRQEERKVHVAGAEAELAGENARGREIEARDSSTTRRLTTAELKNKRSEEKLRAQQMALVAKTDELETESPTPAGASRARAWRLKVNTVAAETALPTAQRSTRLRALEAEVDAALEKLKR